MSSTIRYAAVAAAGIGGAMAALQCFSPKPAPVAIRAHCVVGPNGKPCNGAAEAGKVSGVVNFEDDGKDCKISYKISGLAPGLHGFHIHEFADFSNGCVSAGPHWNPHKQTHGGPGNTKYCFCARSFIYLPSACL